MAQETAETTGTQNPPANIHQHENAIWLKSPALQQIFSALLEKGDEVRVVGGAPRNHLLGKKVGDIDLATVFTPDQVLAKAKKANIKTIPTGIEHGTITLVVDQTPYEITTLREDVKTDGRHAIVRFGKSWLEDAKRRDFTMNALYVQKDGQLEDPLGTGLKDIASRTIRFIGNPEDRIKEDFLRSLRFYRFAAWYGHAPYDQQAINATIKLRAGLTTLSAERVRSELMKLLSAPEPAEVINTLYKTGLLVDLLASVPNKNPTLKLIDIENKQNQKPNSALRLAQLAAWSEADKNRLMQRFRLSNEECKQIELKLAATSFPAPAEQQAHLKWLYQYGKDEYLSLLKIAWSLSAAPLDNPAWLNLFRVAENRELPEFPVNGDDLIKKGITPGPKLGEALKTLEDIWLSSDMSLTKTDLLNHASFDHILK